MLVVVLLSSLLISGAISTPTRAFHKTNWTPHPDCPFPAPNEIIYLPSTTDCAVFYECVSGNRYENRCPNGTWWNPFVESCDYPGDYCDASNPGTPTKPLSTPARPSTTTPVRTTTTTRRTTTTTTVTTTTTLSPEQRCKNELEVSYWPHPQHCHLFIECYEGDAYEMACPTGLYFSESQKRCVNAGEAECCASGTTC